MSTAEEFHEVRSGSSGVDKDPWGHEHGEGDRGESVPLHQAHRPATGAHLVGEPVKIRSGHRRSLIAVLLTAVLLTAALAAAAITAVVVTDWF